MTGALYAWGADRGEVPWREYGGSAEASQYSKLGQINRANVAKLAVAWSYASGDGDKYSFNPIMVHGLVYVMAKHKAIVALDAVTGKEVWTHETNAQASLITNRGINYWESADGVERRLLFAQDNFLQAIDARTGQSITNFGKQGRVDLREGLGRDPESLTLVQSTTPGRVFENWLILGSATNEEYASAPGDIRAYDVRTGALFWTFHTIPHPGELGYKTWPPDAWKTVGGANAWSELSLDEKRGVVYVPTASPKYNFYGANRTGANLFGDCLLALDARTGKRLWHFQMVHHDIWDYDNATAPKLLTVRHGSKKMDIVAQVNKEGFVWVFNRDTGDPLWPIEERAVPQAGMPAEHLWPTQPFPLKPPSFGRQTFTAKDVSPFMEAAERAKLVASIEGARNEGMFTPPTTRDTIEMPGNNGGANLGGAAIDPRSGMLYVVSKDLPAMLKLKLSRGQSPAENDPAKMHYRSGFGFMFTAEGLPAIAPPWTTLTAYDLNEGAIKWKIALGDVPRLADRGAKDTGSDFPKVGPVVTAGGLIFTGTRDRKVRALDAKTGKVLWEKEMSAALEGMPAVYQVGGREYVVFCAAAPDTNSGRAGGRLAIQGAYVAFSLPRH